MIDDSKYIIRRATLDDKSFIADVIIEAEKSGTDNCGLAKLYGLNEVELKEYLVNILEEEIDGCEYSISSFMVIEYDGEPVAAGGGWLEGDNEDAMSSSILKANLLAYYIPQENIMQSQTRLDIVKDIQIKRELGAFQMEYAYVKKEHQGHFLYNWLVEELLKQAKQTYPDLKIAQAHVFENNKLVVLLLKMLGFKVIGTFVSQNKDIKLYYPDSVILLMEKKY